MVNFFERRNVTRSCNVQGFGLILIGKTLYRKQPSIFLQRHIDIFFILLESSARGN